MSIVLQGSTSGSVTLQEPAVAGTTVLTLPAVSGNVLTDTSPKAGNVLQVVQASYGTEVTNSTLTFADTGLTATITPTSSSSKILVIVNHPECYKSPTSTENSMKLNICRNGSQVVAFNHSLGYQASASRLAFSTSYTYLDSPASTSSVAYKTQFAQGEAANSLVSVQWYGTSAPSTITLLEIAG
jgi:hypothetical protein